ncbi:MAG: SET domain-containing protein-lysine N-methyltransferase [Verrucomicrobia bacterium]|nr:SET domain-containing protein-lysine N-methyltransferase [Verrucomicrobiota bacterium]MBS0637243.1 SET domain-containing protein-lysine N-methyltransferase [Verrucomicrobiota bacterium]
MFSIQKKGSSQLQECSVADFEAFFGIKYLPTSYYESSELKDEVRKSCPWLLKNTVVGEEHRSLGAFLHKALESGKVTSVAIKWIDDVMGYGLFAKNFIAKESFIGQYTGIVTKEIPESTAYCMQLPTKFWSLRRYYIDAESAGNELRFANHSDTPSMRPYCLIDRGLVHVGFFALADIEAGRELTFDYGRDYWIKRSKI